MRDIRPISRSFEESTGSISPRPESPIFKKSVVLAVPKVSVQLGHTRSKPSWHASSPWFWGGVALIGVGVFFGGTYWKERVMAEGEAGYQAMEKAASLLRTNDLQASQMELRRAEEHFERGQKLLFGTAQLLPMLNLIPGLGEGVSGVALMQAGMHLTKGAQALTVLLFESKQRLHQSELSLLDLLVAGEPVLETGGKEFQEAVRLFQYVDLESIPEEKRESFSRGERLLTVLAQTLTLSGEHTNLLQELLGKNGPRVYLFLFQNNHELRPTGGFIGSYALLDINNGKIRRFFVDGIFNPDGQLKENIVPPAPIQKISAGWSLHDSNWFPDFPTSAEKAMFFYEKTGGPTTDGVVALTPVVLARLLEIIGPINLPEYGVTVDKENFMSLIQEEVEVKYNKEENTPKKILGDLTGVILDRLVSAPKEETFLQLADAFVSLLNERHILLYAREPKAQELINASGWSGTMLSTPYDYLSVIHANINGYKTDGVVDDVIRHAMSIQADGSIIDTLTVTREHRGGDTPYEWWNKVNANYMRVYVPLGSELLSAEGMTREFPVPPLDYDALDFRRDEEVVKEESLIRVDEASGTRIGEEFGKTVFGNWVYVSPGENVTVTYRYRLPFRLAVVKDGVTGMVPFSVLYQKQAGTVGAKLSSQIEYPEYWKSIWQSAENLVPYGRALKLNTILDHTIFAGTVFDTNRK